MAATVRLNLLQIKFRQKVAKLLPKLMGNIIHKGIGITLIEEDGDLVCEHTIGSNFGDPKDVVSGQDNGIGANGFHYVKHPEFLGVALPLHRSSHHLSGSPIPGGLPIRNADGSHKGIHVRIQSLTTKEVVTAELVDLGPAGEQDPVRGIDLLQAVVKALGHTMKEGFYPVRFRIIGGCKYL